MGYVYSALWFMIAVLLFFKFRKESKIVYVLSAYFVFAGVWWLLNEMTKLEPGVFGSVFRAVSVLMLAVLAVTYFLEKRKTENSASSDISTISDLDAETDSR